jgi:hypothetical protein
VVFAAGTIALMMSGVAGAAVAIASAAGVAVGASFLHKRLGRRDRRRVEEVDRWRRPAEERARKQAEVRRKKYGPTDAF